jgi:hypothetical protein
MYKYSNRRLRLFKKLVGVNFGICTLEMSANFETRLTVKNEVRRDVYPEMHYIFFQEPQNPGLGDESFVWRKLDVQSGGSGEFSVPFKVDYQASITTRGGALEKSQILSAKSGDILSVTKSEASDAPMLKREDMKSNVPRTAVHYVTVKNSYDGDRNVQITALKDGRDLVRKPLRALGDVAEFDIHSVVYLAWQDGLEEGDNFRCGTYAGNSKKIDLTDETTGNPAQAMTVRVYNPRGSNEILVD